MADRALFSLDRMGEIVGQNPEKSDRGPPRPRLGEPNPSCRGKEARPEGLSGVTQHAQQLSAQVYCTYLSPGAEGGGVRTVLKGQGFLIPVKDCPLWTAHPQTV